MNDLSRSQDEIADTAEYVNSNDELKIIDTPVAPNDAHENNVESNEELKSSDISKESEENVEIEAVASLSQEPKTEIETPEQHDQNTRNVDQTISRLEIETNDIAKDQDDELTIPTPHVRLALRQYDDYPEDTQDMASPSSPGLTSDQYNDDDEGNYGLHTA